MEDLTDELITSIYSAVRIKIYEINIGGKNLCNNTNVK